jgi:arsenate reductase
MAEGILRHFGGERFEVYSAGTEPAGVNPLAIRAMQEAGIDISGHSSKSVNEFVGRHFDYVITVCDQANESCPVFPGDPQRIHWSFPDPSAVEGSGDARYRAFERTARELTARLRTWIQLPHAALLGC